MLNRRARRALKKLADTQQQLLGFQQTSMASSMVGKQVTFIANLAPRKMMGIESQGMILMAEDSEGKLSFISPEKDFGAGCEVR